ncbi:MAG: potassium channel family protein [Actinomycetota bacterium]
MNALSTVQMPRPDVAPLAAILRRVALAAGLVVFVAMVVFIGRDGYIDVNDDPISFLDAVYYASVTVTTTGYGDISATSDGARLATILFITPARILFLILVVSTTVEVLTEQSRLLRAKQRWRQHVKDHTVICGFGATGRAAARDLITRGMSPSTIVAVDLLPEAVEAATRAGFVGVVGDATATVTLEQAGVREAAAIVVAPNRDDTAVLITLTVREMNPTAHITAGGRDQENLHLLRQGGADEVIDATAAIGRMLGLGTVNPAAVRVFDDLLDAGDGLEIVELEAETSGADAVPAGATLVAIVRDDRRLPQERCVAAEVVNGDTIVVLRES